jgi:hypothetical protein
MMADNPYKQVSNSIAQQQNNERIYNRNIPSNVLQPYLNVRPVQTKYSYFPIVDPRKNIKEPFINVPTYDPHKTFNPGTRNAPFSGFSANVNVESELRNQIYALQKCSQSVYVPKSTSDLYEYTFTSKKVANPHELLFHQESFSEFNPNPNDNICGVSLFNNNTRCQIKEIPNTCYNTNTNANTNANANANTNKK